MEIERRALYTALRFNWLSDPTLEVEPWQVENYREMSIPLIFSRLKHLDYQLDKESFEALSNSYESPEDLVEDLVADEELSPEKEDQLYLLFFELWRRLKKEQPSLSIFCEELDHQIFLYDEGKLKSTEEIQDLLGKLQLIIEDNSEEGADPESILYMISCGCANDIEGFLLDFIIEQIEVENYSYAQDLLENFSSYTSDKKWFELLKLKLVASVDPALVSSKIEELAEIALDSNDLDFCLEFLLESVYEGDTETFMQVVKHSIPLLKSEEDFKDLASVCIEFLRLLDKDEEVESLEKLVNERAHILDEHPFKANDSAAKAMVDSLNTALRM